MSSRMAGCARLMVFELMMHSVAAVATIQRLASIQGRRKPWHAMEQILRGIGRAVFG
jgi:hypothetical protein